MANQGPRERAPLSASQWESQTERGSIRGANQHTERKDPHRTGGQGCQASWGKLDAPGSEGPRGRRGRANLASHSPMAVRTAETMTTASEPALILPQDHLTRRCRPLLLASEAPQPFPAADILHRGAELQVAPPTVPRCAGARARRAEPGSAELRQRAGPQTPRPRHAHLPPSSQTLWGTPQCCIFCHDIFFQLSVFRVSEKCGATVSRVQPRTGIPVARRCESCHLRACGRFRCVILLSWLPKRLHVLPGGP